ncbi:TIGR02302 family protein [Rhodospirillum centenum]|uniref:TIGR02302 family protein n=1 Tax=Rhodospirillum centenum (strain ATCC 51521 / SW) TaxID=414684 RepID=B6IYR5_RHOCS|nr:TIGR02302 family protein [Rhodospirillum centenum]ACJ01439.1 conserved hypothetical protein [Rhodospirillum centenum SW]
MQSRFRAREMPADAAETPALRRGKAPDAPGLRLHAARAALAWERLWPRLWPAVGVAGLFLAAALFGLPPLLPGWLHLLVLLATAGGVGWLAVTRLRGFRWPGVEEGRRRLERDSALAHRPLATLRDGRATGDGDPVADALWQMAQERARRQVRDLRLNAPHPNLLARDPWALRIALGLVLLVAASVARDDWSERLGLALQPRIAGLGPAAPASLDVWITPPDYTGLPPVFLTRQPVPAAGTEGDGADAAPAAPVDIPVGSTLLARVSGGSGTPELEIDGSATPFTGVAGGGFQIDRPVGAGQRLSVTQRGRELGAWNIRVVPDMGPGIAFRTPPAATERHATRIDYTAADDYGVARAVAVLTLAAETAPGIDRTPLELPLPLPGVTPRQVAATGFTDLTPHPWAGLPVSIRLEATDGAGQTGRSAEQPFVLPERPFSHPVAQAIIAERRRLTLGGDGVRDPVSRALSDISARPDGYRGDLSVFMGLRSAVARLRRNQEPDALASVQDTLWETALRVEDGGLSLAERDLRDAQRELMEALDRNAPDEEIDRLMQQLQQAMQQFMDALEEKVREAMERGEMPPEMPDMPNLQSMDRQGLEQMMERMRELAQTGSREAARQMLSQLQQMMENLRTGQTGNQQQQGQEAARQAMEMMQQLQDLAQRQQELMDETFRQSGEAQDEMLPPDMPLPGMQGPNRQPGQPQPGQPRPGQPGQAGPQGGDPAGMAADQEALRRELGDLMRRFGEMGGEIPSPLGRAERAMRDAGEALEQGLPGQAVPSQGQAVDQLQQGLETMVEQMQQQMMAAAGMRPGQRPQAGRQPGRDPLGRQLPGQGMFNTDRVKIPEEGDVQRSREILEELRRRAGEPDRPKLERDYIERLLDRF